MSVGHIELTREQRCDRESGLAAAKENVSSLKYASVELRSDREFMLAAAKLNTVALKFASDELRGDREFMLAAVKNVSSLEYASDNLRSDREFMLAAVKRNVSSLEYASHELRSDREFIFAAVKMNGLALEYASHDLRLRREIVHAAVLQNKEAWQFADKSLWSDVHFLLEGSERPVADTRFTLDPIWGASTVREKFYASGKLDCSHNASAPPLLPLVGYRISSIELVSNGVCAAATSALSRMWGPASRQNHRFTTTSEQDSVRRVFEELLRDSGGDRMIVYHGCCTSAASSIAEHGFVRRSLRDNGYFGKGIYTTPNAEYACLYATNNGDLAGAVVMCRACVPFVYCVTLADYDGSSGHSKLCGQALKNEEAHFALVSRSSNFEACTPETADYCELCVSQIAALCPIAILWVEAGDGTAVVAAETQWSLVSGTAQQLSNITQQPTNSQQPQSFNSQAQTTASREMDQRTANMLAAMKLDGLTLKSASFELRSDHEIVFAAVKQNGLSLEYASYKLQADRAVVLAAVEQDGLALEYASYKLQADREVVLTAVKEDGLALDYAAYELRLDRELILAAVKQNGLALKYASDELRSDREFMLAAVKQNNLTLKFASDKLLSDREFMLAAEKEVEWAAKYASAELRSDREFMLAAAKLNYLALEYASYELRSDREFMLAAAKENVLSREYASNELKSNREFMLADVEMDYHATERTSNKLQEFVGEKFSPPEHASDDLTVINPSPVVDDLQKQKLQEELDVKAPRFEWAVKWNSKWETIDEGTAAVIEEQYKSNPAKPVVVGGFIYNLVAAKVFNMVTKDAAELRRQLLLEDCCGWDVVVNRHWESLGHAISTIIEERYKYNPSDPVVLGNLIYDLTVPSVHNKSTGQTASLRRLCHYEGHGVPFSAACNLELVKTVHISTQEGLPFVMADGGAGILREITEEGKLVTKLCIPRAVFKADPLAAAIIKELRVPIQQIEATNKGMKVCSVRLLKNPTLFSRFRFELDKVEKSPIPSEFDPNMHPTATQRLQSYVQNCPFHTHFPKSHVAMLMYVAHDREERSIVNGGFATIPMDDSCGGRGYHFTGTPSYAAALVAERENEALRSGGIRGRFCVLLCWVVLGRARIVTQPQYPNPDFDTDVCFIFRGGAAVLETLLPNDALDGEFVISRRPDLCHAFACVEFDSNAKTQK